MEKQNVEEQQTNLSYQLFKNESTPFSPYKVNNVMYVTYKNMKL